MATIDDVARVAGDRYGPRAHQDVSRCEDRHAGKLAELLDRLPTLSDADLFTEVCAALWESATVSRFGGFHDVHATETLVSAEIRARHVAAGHDPECRGSTIRDRAYNRVVQQAGHPGLVRPPQPCTCGAQQSQ
jgi:hypothetical protein